MDNVFYMVENITERCHTNPDRFQTKDEAIEFANWIDNLWSKSDLKNKTHIYECREIDR